MKKNTVNDKKDIPAEQQKEISEPPKEPASTSPVSSQPVTVSSENIPQKGIKGKVTLSVRAKQDGWLQVKSDGNVVFQTILKKGATETWTADKEIEISGRNISQLEFELNGRLIGSLGRDDRNAKRVVFTKQGLSVKR